MFLARGGSKGEVWQSSTENVLLEVKIGAATLKGLPFRRLRSISIDGKVWKLKKTGPPANCCLHGHILRGDQEVGDRNMCGGVD